MKKTAILCGILVAILAGPLLASCGRSPAAQALTDEAIVIGAAFNSTGWMAAYDMPPRDGALLAVQEINRTGGVLGRPLRIIELDGKSDPTVVANATLQLIEQGAQFILAPTDFDIGSPASQVAQEAGLIGISPSASSPLYNSEILGHLQFTAGMWNNTMSAAAAEFAYKTMGWRTAYVVTDTSIDYSLSLGRYFTRHFRALGGAIVGEDTYVQGDQDFSAQTQRIKALRVAPEVIFISSYLPDLGTMVRQVRSSGVTAPIMGGDCYDTPEFWNALGPYANNIYFSTHSWLGPEAAPGMAHFIELYTAEYGKAPDNAFIVMGWDAVYALAQAIEKAEATDSQAVARAMERFEYEGLSGTIDWSNAANGHFPEKAAAIVKLDKGECTFQGWVLPQSVPEP